MRDTLRSIGILALMTAVAPYAANAGERSEVVTLEQVPKAVRASIEREVGQTEIRKIERTDEDGVVAYEVDLREKSGKRELVFDADGALLSAEEELGLQDVPEAVRKTIQQQAAGGKVEDVEKITEKGRVTYEAEVTKAHRTRELTIAADGTLIAEETEDSHEDD